MQTLDMKTPNFTDTNIEKLAQLFPNILTETKDENGKLKKAIDFELLKQELSGDIVEGSKERYSINWAGKRESLLKANQPITKTLRPNKEQSVDFDTTENLYIEGDNLEALKLLQESYLNKIKMIYIDPPYNTGKDFVYKDNFTKDTDEFLQEDGQKDEDGGRLVTNLDSNGRYHSDWLSMMYPRLKLARNLLKDDGVIFISIDDNEVHNLRKLCDEVFGEDNFVAKLVHKNNSMKNQTKFIGVTTEYILIYTKNIEKLKEIDIEWKEKKKGAKDIVTHFNKLKSKNINLNEIKKEILDMYAKPKYSHIGRWNKVDEDGIFMDDNLSREGGSKNYTIKNPNTGEDCKIPPRGWAKSYEELLRLQDENMIWYGSGDTPPRIKSYLSVDTLSVPDNYCYYDTSIDKKLIDSLFESKRIFEYPKSLELIEWLISLLEKNSIVLDFFSGSATTAHAVMQLNAEDGGSRKHICVQIPELTDEKSEAYKAGYKNICEIGKERIRRAGKKILEDNQALKEPKDLSNLDTGFRVLKIDESNMKEVHFTPDKLTQNSLFDTVDNIKTERSSEDLLFGVMLDWGADLSSSIETKTIQNKTIYFVNDNDLLACFDTGITQDLIKELAKISKEEDIQRVVFRDKGFESDDLKDNIEQIFKQVSDGTEVRVI